MNDKIDEVIGAAASGKIGFPVVGASLLASASPELVTQWAAMLAAILYVGVQAVAFYRQIAAARKEAQNECK